MSTSTPRRFTSKLFFQSSMPPSVTSDGKSMAALLIKISTTPTFFSIHSIVRRISSWLPRSHWRGMSLPAFDFNSSAKSYESKITKFTSLTLQYENFNLDSNHFISSRAFSVQESTSSRINKYLKTEN